MTCKPTVSRPELLDLATRCYHAKSMRGAIRILANFRATLPRIRKNGSWWREFGLVISALKHGQTRYHVFMADGNGKLPFVVFSTVPIVTCPGKAECAVWCYSLRSWQYPGAYLRQLQNTLLLRFCPDSVADAFRAIDQGRTVRLYVDGDFESTERVAFWMHLIRARPDLPVYGYSKSWTNMLAYATAGGIWPDNYALNLSTGGAFDSLPAWHGAMSELPITRGDFVSVPIDGTGLPRGKARYDSPIYHARVREALREKYGKRVASCPGNCGNCGNDGQHWCGDRKLHGLTIGIGIH